MKENFLALLLMIGGLLLLIESYNVYDELNQLESHGLEIISEPITEYTREVKGGNTVGYSIRVKYKVPYAGVFTCYGKVKKEVIDHLSNVNIIKVRYLPNDPTVCSVENADSSEIVFHFVVGFILVLGSSFYIYNRL